MGTVYKFKRPRNKTIKGHARECLTDAVKATGEPRAVVIVSLGCDGSFAVRTAFNEDMQQFDVYARAEALVAREKSQCIAHED